MKMDYMDSPGERRNKMTQEFKIEYLVHHIDCIKKARNGSLIRNDSELYPNKQFRNLSVDNAIKIFGRNGFNVEKSNTFKRIAYGTGGVHGGVTEEVTVPYTLPFNENKDLAAVVKFYSLNGTYHSNAGPGFNICLRSELHSKTAEEIFRNMDTFKKADLEAVLTINEVFTRTMFNPSFFKVPSKIIEDFENAMYDVYKSLCVKETTILDSGCK